MDRIKSKSEKRLIIEGRVNGKSAYFLLDSGASVGLLDENQQREYRLEIGRKYGGTLVGASGKIRARHCDTFVEFENKLIPQFLLADINGVVSSIRRETGIEILGIISLSQMGMIGMNIDINSREIWLE